MTVASPARRRGDIGRTAAAVSLVNVASRLTGFVRVIATGAALGIAILGDTYQSANVVSNVLFELLAGGLLFAVLVPAFVARTSEGDQAGARALAGVLVARLAVGLGAVVVLGIALAPRIADLLLAGAPLATRADQADLAAVLLWFVLPQIVFYALGAVITALLQAEHRFLAAAAAPIANNVVVTATMVAFALAYDPVSGVDLTTREVVVLGGGTLLGTVAMTSVVLVAAARAGLSVRPRWRDPAVGPLGPLARQGAWGAGHIGLNQIMVLSTVLISGRVEGGAIAYTFAFTFFLLPHAVLAHPIVTTLTPGLAEHAHRGDDDAFAADLGRGLRMLVVLLAPSAALLAALAAPVLHLMDGVGSLTGTGLDLVAATLAAYATGLVGYSAFFLLTRAAYAVGDVADPTIVNAVATAAAVAGMLAASALAEGDARVWSLGLVHGAAVTVAAVVLARRLAARTRPASGVAGAVGRALAAAAAGGLAAAGVAAAIGWDDRLAAVVASAAGALVGGLAVVAVLSLLRAPELEALRRRLPGRLGGRGGGAEPGQVVDGQAVGTEDRP